MDWAQHTGNVLADGTGTAQIGGTINGVVTADIGGTVTGSGVVGSLEARTGGTLSPGAAVGAMTVGSVATPGTLALRTGSTLKIELASATSYDSLKVNGTVTLEGTVGLDLVLSYDPTDLVDVFTIVLNDGDSTDPLLGGGLLNYKGTPLAEGTIFTAVTGAISQNFKVSMVGGDGNDLTLSAIPEPGSAVGLLGGMGLLLGLQRFRRRASEQHAA